MTLSMRLAAVSVAMAFGAAPVLATPAHKPTKAVSVPAKKRVTEIADKPVPPPDAKLSYGRFGDIVIYKPAGAPREFVLFFSGDGSWDYGVYDMAKKIAGRGALVAGIDIRHYMTEMENAKDKCISVAVDLENLSHYLQAKLENKSYLQPTLVGYSSGAVLAYAVLVQSPENLFKGALSIGFCPDLDLRKPLCKGEGLQFTPRHDKKGVMNGIDYLPAKKLSGRWIALQGAIDEVCPAAATVKFIGQVPGAEVVVLPKVGHGYTVEKNWITQFGEAYDKLIAPAPAARRAPILPADVADLPLTEVPAAPAAQGVLPRGAPASAVTPPQGTPLPAQGGSQNAPTSGAQGASAHGTPTAGSGARSDWFAVFLSGDGGWVGLDRGVSAALAEQGIPVIGWDSLKYFWSARTPEGAAADLDRVLRHFARAYGKSRALLVGYSQGADTLPFMVNRLPRASRDLVGLTALLGLSDSAYFEFHVTHWLGNPAGGLPTKPEMARWSGSPFLCIYGEDESDSFCPQLEAMSGKQGTVLKMPGGHHFGGGYADIATQIIKQLPR